jgi:beta-phosphoglucomutase-like phosphatase (HAD superfamily)
MTKIKAVIFDMDGVLIDAKDWHYDALNKALELFGMQISRHEHICSFDGLPTKKKLEMLSLERGLPYKLHDFIHSLKQKYTLEIVYTACKPTFYHQFALSQLKEAGYKIVCCSNSVRKSIEIMMEKADLARYLDFYLSSQDVEHPKPNPEIYNKAIARLGLQPEECLIVEDNINGIKAALASGAHLLKVSGVEDVNLPNILHAIKEKESSQILEPAVSP